MGELPQPRQHAHQEPCLPPLPDPTVIMQSSLIVLALLPLAISGLYLSAPYYSRDLPDRGDLSYISNGRGGVRLGYAMDSYDVNTIDTDNLVYGGGAYRYPLGRSAFPLIRRA